MDEITFNTEKVDISNELPKQIVNKTTLDHNSIDKEILKISKFLYLQRISIHNQFSQIDQDKDHSITIHEFTKIILPVVQEYSMNTNVVTKLWNYFSPNNNILNISSFFSQLSQLYNLSDPQPSDITQSQDITLSNSSPSNEQDIINDLLIFLSNYRIDPVSTFQTIQQFSSPGQCLSLQDFSDAFSIFHKNEMEKENDIPKWVQTYPLGLPESIIQQLYTIFDIRNERVFKSDFVEVIIKFRKFQDQPIYRSNNTEQDNPKKLNIPLSEGERTPNSRESSQSIPKSKETKDNKLNINEKKHLSTLMNEVLALQEDFAIKVHHCPRFYDLEMMLDSDEEEEEIE